MVAVRTDNEKMFEQVIEKGSIDIISFDMGERLGWFINKKKVKEALAQEISFEIMYGPHLSSPGARKCFLQQGINLVRLT